MTVEILSIGAALPHGPGLADLIQIIGGGGSALGVFIGLVVPTPLADPDRMLQNAGKGALMGGAIGTAVAFALWVAIRLNGGVG